MGIYLILLVIVIILAILLGYSSSDKNIRKTLFIFLTFIMLFSIMGFRNRSVGVDTDLYCRIYTGFVHNTVNNDNFDTSKIYEYYNILIGKLFGDNARNIIIFNSLFIILLFFIFINKESPNIYFSVILYILLYFYLQGFNIARQMLAIFLSAISMRHVINKDIKKYLLINIVAIFIHNTSIVIFLVGLLLMFIKKMNLKKFVIIMIVGIVSVTLVDRLMYLFISIFPKYASYLSTSNYDFGSGRKILLVLVYGIFLIIGLYAISRKKNEMSENQYRKYMIYSTLVGVSCITGIFGSLSILVGRVSLYFEIFMIIYIPMIIELIGKRKEIWYLLTTILLFIPFYVQLLGNISGVVPYQLYK